MAKINFKLSISTKVFILSIMTGMVVLLAYIFSSLQIVSSIFDSFYKEKALSIISSLNTSIGLDDLDDELKLQGIITKFIYLNPDINKLSINLVDKNEKLVVVAANNLISVGQQSDGDNQGSFLNESVISQSVKINSNEKGLRVISPITLSGQKVGTYELYLSTQKAWDELQKKMTIFLLLISIFVLFSAFIFYLVTRRSIIYPINKLISGVDEVGRGNLDYRIAVESNDEVGKLAQAFNENTDKIADLYRNIEGRVDKRTLELNEILDKIEKQNISLENNKRAMLNILEDDRELEKELKEEKDGVERKVVERTMELSNTKAKLDSSIENLPLGFLMVDVEEKMVVTNSLAKKILGSGDEKISLETLKTLLKEKIDLSSYIKNCGVDKKRLALTDIEMNGKYFQFLLSPILTKETKELCIGIVVLIQDITEAKILERSKDEFFSIASHELRTPLTAIRGNTSMILEYYSDAIKDPELKAMVDDIHESSIRLINIVNDFLNVSRLEQSRMVFDIKEFDLNEIIKETLKEYNVTGSRKKLSLDYEEPKDMLPKVLGDADKVRQVLINLVGNSLKFTAKGGVTINTEVLDKFIKVLVSDTGRGIPLKQQSLLFHKFQQAGTSLFTRDTAGGSGLGLYISRMMIEGMGGEVKLEKSEENVGSTFSFTVPIVKKSN